jgi:hypothetical protein
MSRFNRTQRRRHASRRIRGDGKSCHAVADPAADALANARPEQLCDRDELGWPCQCAAACNARHVSHSANTSAITADGSSRRGGSIRNALSTVIGRSFLVLLACAVCRKREEIKRVADLLADVPVF